MLDVRAAGYLLQQRGHTVRVEWIRRLTTFVSIKRLGQFHSVETSTTQSPCSLANRGNICHRFGIREARLFYIVTDTEEFYAVVVSACLMSSDRPILTSHSCNSGRLLILTSHSAQAYSDSIPFTWVVWKFLFLDHRWQHYRQDCFP
jgi:hypothetical protein